MKHTKVSVFVLALLISASAGATDCKLSYSHPNKAWNGSCGLSGTDGAWKGYLQGSLVGAKLEFRSADGENKKVTIDGGALGGLSITKLEEIPFCAAVDPDTKSKVPEEKAQLEICQKIAAAAGITVPFYLKGYSQEPTAFTVGTKWDKKSKSIAAGNEMKVPVCDPSAEKLPKESEAVADFRKTMECRWVAVKPPMYGSGGPLNTGYSTPEFKPDQAYLPGSQTEAPDLFATVAIGCGAASPNGSMKVCTGRIICEDRSRRKFPAERDPTIRGEQFAKALKAAGIPSLAEFAAAKDKTAALEDGRMNGEYKGYRKAVISTLPKDENGNAYLPEGYQRNHLPRLKLKDEGKEKGSGYVQGLNYFPNGQYGADILGGDIRRYSTEKNPDLTELYALMRIPPAAQVLARLPIKSGADANGCMSAVLDASATKEDREFLKKLDLGIKNGGGFGLNQSCVRVAEVGNARKYIADRMDFESVAYAAKADLWAGANSVTAAKNGKIIEEYGTTITSVQNLTPSYLANDRKYLDYELAEYVVASPRFQSSGAPIADEKGVLITAAVDRVKANRKHLMEVQNDITKELNIDNKAAYSKTDKALVTDPMEASCVAPEGKACNPTNVDPISCFTDNRIARMTQGELRDKKTPVGSKSPDQKVKDAKNVFQAK